MSLTGRTPDTSQIAAEIVNLAAHAVHARLDGALATSIVVWRGGRIDPGLCGSTAVAARPHQALAGTRPDPGDGGPAEHSAVALARTTGRPVQAALDDSSTAGLSAPGSTGARRLVAEPLPEVDGVLAAWLPGTPGNDPDPVAAEALHDSVSVVTAAVRNAEQLRGLVVVPETRLVIEQAKGMLMARHGVDADAAFTLLRRTSQQLNVPVRDLAHDVVAGRPPVGLADPLAHAAERPRV